MPDVGVIVAQKFEGLRLRWEFQPGLCVPDAATVVMRWGMLDIGKIERTEVFEDRIVRCRKAPARGDKDARRDGLHVTAKDTGVETRIEPDIVEIEHLTYLRDKHVIGIDGTKKRAVDNLHERHRASSMA